MKKIILMLVLMMIGFTSISQTYTFSSGDASGYFKLNGIDYPKGHFSLIYDDINEIEEERIFTLKNIYTNEFLINSRKLEEVVNVSSYSDLINTLEYYGVINTVSSNMPFSQQVAENLISGYDSEFKFGENQLIGSTEEVIWDAGGTYVFLDTAEYISIVSTDSDDNISGTGARIVQVFGLDSLYRETNQIIQMNGTTPVITDTLFLRVFRAVVLVSGANSPTADANEGTITFTSSNSTILQAQINPRNGQTLMCVYTVPAGKEAYITGITFGIGEGKECSFKGKFRNGVNGAFSVKYALTLYQSSFFGTLKIPLKVPEKIDIVITGVSTTPSGVKGDASFGFYLKDITNF